MNEAGHAVVAIVSGILAVAIVAVLVSQQAQTGSILTSAGTALSGAITAAVAPVSTNSNNGILA